MKKNILLCAFLSIFAGAAAASSSAAFDEMMTSYEDIRLVLLDDSMDGIAEPAAALRDKAEKASGDEANGEEVRSLLPKIAAHAARLAEASDLETAREAFHELSKMMVQYRAKVAGDELPVVMYCSMAKKSWLQLEEEVGNPYYGQSMARCGEVVGP